MSLGSSTLALDWNPTAVSLADLAATSLPSEVARPTSKQGGEVPDDKLAPPNEVGASLYTLPSSNHPTLANEVPDDKLTLSNEVGATVYTLPSSNRFSSKLVIADWGNTTDRLPTAKQALPTGDTGLNGCRGATHGCYTPFPHPAGLNTCKGA